MSAKSWQLVLAQVKQRRTSTFPRTFTSVSMCHAESSENCCRRSSASKVAPCRGEKPRGEVGPLWLLGVGEGTWGTPWQMGQTCRNYHTMPERCRNYTRHGNYIIEMNGYEWKLGPVWSRYVLFFCGLGAGLLQRCQHLFLYKISGGNIGVWRSKDWAANAKVKGKRKCFIMVLLRYSYWLQLYNMQLICS